jgi:hypothetical protein
LHFCEIDETEMEGREGREVGHTMLRTLRPFRFELSLEESFSWLPTCGLIFSRRIDVQYLLHFLFLKGSLLGGAGWRRISAAQFFRSVRFALCNLHPDEMRYDLI